MTSQLEVKDCQKSYSVQIVEQQCLYPSPQRDPLSLRAVPVVRVTNTFLVLEPLLSQMDRTQK